jgi:hypothetical protein
MGGKPGKWTTDTALSSGRGFVCALTYDNIKCWGDERASSVIAVPALKNPRQVSAGNEYACALDDDGLKCWGRGVYSEKGKYLPLKAPLLKNPRQVTLAFSYACAIDDDGVKCWDDYYPDFRKVPGLKNPRQIRSGDFKTCALDDDGVKCWDHLQYDRPYSVTQQALKAPRQLSADDSHVCVLDEDGLKCWGLSHQEQIWMPELNHPRKVEFGSYQDCVLDDDGVKCWRHGASHELIGIPPLKNPRQVSTGDFEICALDDDGVKCWDAVSNSSFKFEATPRDLYFTLFSALKGQSSPSRFSFYNVLSFFEAIFENDTKHFESIYLFYSLLKPVIETTQSEYFETTLIPKYRDYLSKLRMQGKFTEINEITDSVLNRQIALKQMEAAFRASLAFFSMNEKAEIQVLIQSVQTTYQHPNDTNIKATLTLLAQKQSTLNILKKSERSAFVPDALILSKEWLEAKIH